MQTFQIKQWTIAIHDDDESYEIYNQGKDGSLRFYRVVSGPYGEPLIEQEPDLGIPVPSGIRLVGNNGEPVSSDQKIAGFVCRDPEGNVVRRLSLTNARQKSIEWELSDEGVLTLEGGTYYLQALVLPDKNRMKGLVAFFCSNPREKIELLELEDLVR